MCRRWQDIARHDVKTGKRVSKTSFIMHGIQKWALKPVFKKLHRHLGLQFISGDATYKNPTANETMLIKIHKITFISIEIYIKIHHEKNTSRTSMNVMNKWLHFFKFY